MTTPAVFGSDGPGRAKDTESMAVIFGNKKNNKLVGTDDDDELYGKGGNDKLFGLDGEDSLFGGGGNDTLEGGAGADQLHGGKGVNTPSYKNSPAGVSVGLDDNGDLIGFLGKTNPAGGDAEGDSGTGFTNIIGSSFADLLSGNSADNALKGRGGNDILMGLGGSDTLKGGGGGDSLFGGDGNDELKGGKGDDTLDGGEGNDKLHGGKGNDLFWFPDPGFGKDTIYDFKAGAGSEDVIMFNPAIFKDFDAVKAAAKNKPGNEEERA